MSSITEFLILGVITGSLYGILGIGLVVVHRASGAVNFAHGGVAIAAAYIYLELRNDSIPSGLCAVVGITGGMALGFLIYWLVMRPLSLASALTKAVATLAVLVILQSATTLRYGANPQVVPPFLPQGRLEIAGTTVTVQDILIFVICVVLVGVLAYIYHSSRFGIATSALAENEFSFASLGHSATRIASVNWAIGGLLSGLAGVLIAPVIEISPDLTTALLIPALAVTLCSGFRSFWITLGAGMLIGIGQAELAGYATSNWLSDLPGLSDSLPFLIIIVVLAARGDRLPARDFVVSKLPRIGSARLSIPWIIAWTACALVCIYVLPVEWVTALTTGLITAILLASLVLLAGYAGQLSLAQVSIGGVGLLVASMLVADAHLSMFLSGVIGVLATLPIALVVGLPALRTRGIALAVVTLGLAYVLNSMVFTRTDVNVGGAGVTVGNANFLGIDVDSLTYPRRYALLALIVLAVVLIGIAMIRRSHLGRVLIAIRTNERAAASLGISVWRAKLFAFVVAGGVAALAEILQAWQSPVVVFSTGFDPFQSVNTVVIGTLGGIGYLSGAVFGGILSQPGSVGGTIFSDIGLGEYLSIVTGALLVLNIILNPDGIVPNTLKMARGLGSWLGPRLPFGFPSRGGSWSPALAVTHIDEPGRPDRRGDDVLEVRNMCVSFGANVVVNDVDVTCRGGKVVGIIGPNGSGKTTFIDAVTGYVQGTGEIRLNGRRIDQMSAHRRSALGVARSFQSLELFADLSVAENVLVGDGRDFKNWLRRGLSPAVSAAIHSFGLQHDLDRLPSELPYGKRRLLAISRVLASRPRVLMLDEPAAGLDDSDRAELRQVIRRLAKDGIGVILIEHDVELVMDVSDHVIAFDQGCKIAEGTPDAVRSDPHVIRAYLGTGEGLPAGRRVCRDLVGPEIPDTVLRVKDMSAGYNGVMAVNKLDMEIAAGEVVALLGANGAGKTTTLLTIAGALSPIRGSIEIFGRADRRPTFRLVREGLALLPEQRSVFMGLTVEDNLKLRNEEIDQAVALFPELERKLKTRAGLISGGEQQMLALARIIAARPKLILADELSLGLAPLVIRRLWESLAAAAKDGAAVLVVEQHPHIALKWSDRAFVMRRGQIVMTGPSQDLLSRMQEVTAQYL